MRNREVSICGLSAVRSRFAAAPLTIKRLFFTQDMAPDIGDICRALAEARHAYRCVEPEDLERISGSVHHGGIVAVVERPQLRAPEPREIREWAARGEPLLILDCIGNPHNLGAIIRSAAYFGVTRLVLADHPLAALPTDSTYRIAAGGLDHLHVYLVRDMVLFLREVRRDYQVVGAATSGGDTSFHSPDRPVALVLGNEEEGLADEVVEECDRLITIPGSGYVESLNVSAAAAILLRDLSRLPRHTRRRPN